MVVLTSAKIRKGYRITLPKEVREHLNLTETSEVLFFTIPGEKGRICFRKVEA
ncbi:MAG: AbrB/MazE/SpoVT family DNA-binding domain-containing protein [Candidatus Bathyarchaeota archaeon]|nr:MAG: AbrB/MazE/SpoVT family DNA-binding domain-containing protein [Candidatus Bathyarchaeota archaeon]